MPLSTPAPERKRRRRILGIRTRDAAIALAVVAVGTATVVDAAADDTGDVHAAAASDVRPASAPSPTPQPRPDEAPTIPSPETLKSEVEQMRAAIAEYEARERAAAREAEEAEARAAADRSAMWERLAECESGNWDRNGRPIRGSARWDYGVAFNHGDHFQGGVNFHPTTWDQFRRPGMPDHAGRATRAQQIQVAEKVLAAQGWGAWPVCSRKIGLR